MSVSTMYYSSSSVQDNQTAEPPPLAPSAPPWSAPPLAHPLSEDKTRTKIISPMKTLTGLDTDSRGPRPWSTGLCNCCQDVHTCCLTCWCPCVTFGRIAEIVDRGSTSCGVSGALYTLILCATGCSCMYSCFYRSKLRGQFFLKESPCTDCCVHCCCEQCALCQEYRELKNQGFDMSIGWHGNMERQKRMAEVAPSVEGGMSR